MTTLASLPSDILELVFDLDDVSYMVIALWKCGNRRLNAMIANSCTSVALVDLGWNSTSRFPKMLRHLRRLKALSISRSIHRLMDAEELGAELQTLSPTLESLELECFEAEACFLAPALEDLNSLFSVEKLRLSLESGAEKPAASRLWDIGACFPKLKTLKLVVQQATLLNADLLELPKTLTNLSLYSHTVEEPPESRFANFPRSLLTLETRGSSWPINYIAQLPPNLTELAVHGTPTSFRPEQWLAMPRSLTRFSTSSGLCMPSTFELLQKLPPHLTEIWFGPNSLIGEGNFLSLLSPQLTTLHFREADTSPVSRHLNFSLLPKTITELNIPAVDWSINSQRPIFPPRLKFLTVGEASEWKLEHWNSLHQNVELKTLVTHARTGSLPTNLVFPPSVTELQIRNAIPAKFSVTTFPERLRKLTLTHCSVDPSTIALLPRRLYALYNIPLSRYPTKEEAGTWPPNLKRMCVAFLGRPDLEPSSAPLHIPSSVTKFRCRNLAGKITKQHMLALPKSLTDLRLSRINTVVCTLEEEAFFAFPPSLRHLECNLTPCASGSTIKSHIESDFLKSLPRSLRFLTINVGILRDKHIPMLPPNVTELRISPQDAHTLTPLAVQLLPPHAHNVKITNTSLEFWNKIYSRVSKIDAVPLQTPDPRVLDREMQFFMKTS